MGSMSTRIGTGLGALGRLTMMVIHTIFLEMIKCCDPEITDALPLPMVARYGALGSGAGTSLRSDPRRPQEKS